MTLLLMVMLLLLLCCLMGLWWEQSVSLAVTEPYAGSDVQGIKTTAVKTEDGKH
jgi:alkylation response protein AidB-like acyl-CoA dehydrogenase